MDMSKTDKEKTLAILEKSREYITNSLTEHLRVFGRGSLKNEEIARQMEKDLQSCEEQITVYYTEIYKKK